MLNKYNKQFSKMYEEMKNSENALEIMKKYANLFDMGILRIFRGLELYVNKELPNEILNTSQ